MLNDEYGCTSVLQYLLQQIVKVIIMKWALNFKHDGANCCFSKKERQVLYYKEWCIHTHASMLAINNNPWLSFQHLRLVTQWLNIDINLKSDYLPRQDIHHASLPYYLERVQPSQWEVCICVYFSAHTSILGHVKLISEMASCKDAVSAIYPLRFGNLTQLQTRTNKSIFKPWERSCVGGNIENFQKTHSSFPSSCSGDN